MAIIVEHLTLNNKEFTHTYSDENRYVVRDGISYIEAYDPASTNRTYTEGDMIVDESSIPDDTELEIGQIAEILLGGSL